ncbi:MAG: HAD family hydrolase [Gemmatimonadota bacterium]
MSTRAAVFLDRDGVLNEVVTRDGNPESPRRIDEFKLAADAVAAVSRLKEAGLPVLVVTNQPDITRGLLPPAELDGMFAQLSERVGIDDAAFCPHEDGEGCECRKPLPGMLRELAQRWDVDLARSFMVGDTWRDMIAGRAAGCRTVLLRTSYNVGTAGDAEAATLSEAVDWILGEVR